MVLLLRLKFFTMSVQLKSVFGVVLVDAVTESNKENVHGFTVWKVSCLSQMEELERLGDARQEIQLCCLKAGVDTST